MYAMPRRILATIAIFVLASVGGPGCGEFTPSAPTAPGAVGGGAPAPSAPVDTPSSGATVTGIVTPKGISALTASTSGAAAALRVSVTVVGTNISAPVDPNGRFVLRGLAPGSVHLRFAGTGIDATLMVSSVDDREMVDLAVELEARFVRIQASVRVKVDNTTEIDGDVASVTGTCPNLSIGVHGWTLKMNGGTQGSCGDVRAGIRIKIRGNRSGNLIVVVKVDVHVSGRPTRGDDDDDDDD